MKLTILPPLLSCLIALTPDVAASDTRSLLIGGESRPAIVLYDNAHLRGARIVGRDSSLLGCAVLVRGRGVVIEDCIIEGGPGAGIALLRGAALIRGCTIISSRDGVSARASDVVIEECLISENAGAGIDLEEGSSLKLSRSSVSLNGGDGLVIGALCRAEFESTSIERNAGFGIRSLFAMTPFDTGMLICEGNDRGDYRIHWKSVLLPDAAANVSEPIAPELQERAMSPEDEIAPALEIAGFHPSDLRLPSDRLSGITPIMKSAMDSPFRAAGIFDAVTREIVGMTEAAGVMRILAELSGDSGRIVSGENALQDEVMMAYEMIRDLPNLDELESALLSEEASPTLIEAHFEVSREKEEADRIGKPAFQVPRADIARRMSFLIAFMLAQDSWLSVVEEIPAGVEGDLRAAWKTDAGWVVIGDSGPNRYPAGIAFIIDAGGDDRYEDAACAESVAPAPSPRPAGSMVPTTLPTSCGSSISAVLDYSGNDLYEGRTCSARGGLALLIDLSGNDRYLGSNATQAFAVSGGAVLWDREGDDYYRAGSGCQSFAIGGLALLLDDGGNDIYSAGSSGQAMSGPNACAALVDRGGDDMYVLRGGDADAIRDPSMRVSYGQGFSIGLRPGPAGGVALLLDGGGNDYYKCDLFGQGVGYWGGFGALVDRGGSDIYRGYYYVQGAGVHLAAGLLMDKDGRDYYQSWTVSQGCGHDLALGILIDEAGDDLYRADNLTQGAGNSNGIGMLMDRAGNDRYMLDHGGSGQGYGVFENMIRRYGSMGIFADLAGADFYSGQGKDGSSWTNGEVGVGWDR